ncbi:MAG: ribosome assembly RNA-binding protein YhbY [Arenicella sp.]|nr:ribosome assembly RNA-binding protein YhbY [Arenicella sp.]
MMIFPTEPVELRVANLNDQLQHGIMTLSGKQKNYLRGIAHNRSPVVSIGNKGFTDAVLKEVELALDKHELIKIKLPGGSKAGKLALLDKITDASGSESVQLIGRVAVLFRAGDEAVITLPSI